MTITNHIVPMATTQGSDDPFADYIWMGEMDKFDREMEAQIEEEFEEEEFIKSCIEQLLDEEEERETVYFNSSTNNNNNNGAVINDECNARIPDPKNNYDGQNFLNMNGLDPTLTQNMNNMYISNNQPPLQQHQQQHTSNHISHSYYQNGDMGYGNGNGPHPHVTSPNHWYTSKEPMPYQPSHQAPPHHHARKFQDDPRSKRSNHHNNNNNNNNNMKKGGHEMYNHQHGGSQPKSWTNIKATDCKMVPPGYLGPYPLAAKKKHYPHHHQRETTPLEDIKVSSLNPNALPFVMNPNAKEFRPQGINDSH